MPKGVPNSTPPPFSTEADRKITLALHAADWARLEALAREQYRTPELQAAYLLMRVLREAANTAQTEELAARLQQRRAGVVVNGAKELAQ